MPSVPTFSEKVTLDWRQEGGGAVSHALRTGERVPGGMGRERCVRGREGGTVAEAQETSDGRSQDMSQGGSRHLVYHQGARVSSMWSERVVILCAARSRGQTQM